MTTLDEILNKDISDLTSLEMAIIEVWKINGLEHVAETASEALSTLQKRVEDYAERVQRLESILCAARDGEYDNAREIHAVERFLRKSISEYVQSTVKKIAKVE